MGGPAALPVRLGEARVDPGQLWGRSPGQTPFPSPAGPALHCTAPRLPFTGQSDVARQGTYCTPGTRSPASRAYLTGSPPRPAPPSRQPASRKYQVCSCCFITAVQPPLPQFPTPGPSHFHVFFGVRNIQADYYMVYVVGEG